MLILELQLIFFYYVSVFLYMLSYCDYSSLVTCSDNWPYFWYLWRIYHQQCRYNKYPYFLCTWNIREVLGGEELNSTINLKPDDPNILQLTTLTCRQKYHYFPISAHKVWWSNLLKLFQLMKIISITSFQHFPNCHLKKAKIGVFDGHGIKVHFLKQNPFRWDEHMIADNCWSIKRDRIQEKL